MVELKKDSSSNVHHGKYGIQDWDNYLKSATERLNSEELKMLYKKNFINFMKDYNESKAFELQEAYGCYECAISTSFIDVFYELLDESEMKRVLTRCKILVITANPIEKAMLHFLILKKSEGRKIIRFICGTNAYFIFKWGEYWVAHIHQHQTGSNKDLEMHSTVNDALKYFKPNVIFSLGVAFGIDYSTQNIGDVIVSKKIFPYSENKRDEGLIKPDRSQDKIVDNWLDVRFVNANGFLDGVTYGGILCGGSVMSSFDEKERVCTAYSKNDYIIGGEMEGNALFQVAQSRDIPCAVIKSICDWGMAKNDIYPEDAFAENVFKDSLQAYAMSQVVDKCNSLFNDKTLFASSKTRDIDDEKKKNKQLIISNLVLIGIVLCLGIYSIWSAQSLFIMKYYGIIMVVVSIISASFILLINWRSKHRKFARFKSESRFDDV